MPLVKKPEMTKKKLAAQGVLANQQCAFEDSTWARNLRKRREAHDVHDNKTT